MSLCGWCAAPLVPIAGQARRTFCNRSCARYAYHRDHPDMARAAGRQSWAKTGRAKFVARLRVALAGCRTMTEAYQRGARAGNQRYWRAGYAAGFDAAVAEWDALKRGRTASTPDARRRRGLPKANGLTAQQHTAGLTGQHL